MDKKIIALSANYAYLDKAETTIKSILWHNQFVKIYLFNYDIPQEWFVNINQYTKQIGSQIVDTKFDPNLLKDNRVHWFYLNKMTYARFLIPAMIKESRVLYLDSDLVVVQSLDELFSVDFAGKKILGVTDYGSTKEINAGVLLLNNKGLRQIPHLSQKLIQYAATHNLPNHDQSVINDYFKNEIGHLPLAYNYMIGLDTSAYWFHRPDIRTFLDQVKNPKIIHYATQDKPFNTLSSGRMRSTWWFYHNLCWPAIVQKYSIFDLKQIEPQKFKGEAFIFTAQAEIDNLQALVVALPELRFNIAAYTEMAPKLVNFIRYPNVKLYKTVIDKKLNCLISNADIYLDINEGLKEEKVINRIKARHIPILSFESVADHKQNYDKYRVFKDDQVKQMIKKIKSIIDNR